MNPKRILNFNPSDYSKQWRENGFLHVPGGVNPEFFAAMEAKVLAELEASTSELQDFAFAGKKRQHLFHFDKDFDYPRGLYEDVSKLTGLCLDRLTLAERHVKAYDEHANPSPVPHKDRLASEVVVGFPVRVSDESYLALYPSAPTDENPYQATALWREHVSPDAVTSELVAGIEPVKFYAKPGDVVFFRGAQILHERFNAANSILVFLKFNSMRMDPIGEDLSTDYLRKRTAGFEATASDAELMAERLEVSPLLEKVTAYYRRRDWSPLFSASLWGSQSVPISEADVAILKNVDPGNRTGLTLAAELPEFSKDEICSAIRRLCKLELLVLADKFPFEVSEEG